MTIIISPYMNLPIYWIIRMIGWLKVCRCQYFLLIEKHGRKWWTVNIHVWKKPTNRGKAM